MSDEAERSTDRRRTPGNSSRNGWGVRANFSAGSISLLVAVVIFFLYFFYLHPVMVTDLTTQTLEHYDVRITRIRGEDHLSIDADSRHFELTADLWKDRFTAPDLARRLEQAGRCTLWIMPGPYFNVAGVSAGTTVIEPDQAVHQANTYRRSLLWMGIGFAMLGLLLLYQGKRRADRHRQEG